MREDLPLFFLCSPYQTSFGRWQEGARKNCFFLFLSLWNTRENLLLALIDIWQPFYSPHHCLIHSEENSFLFDINSQKINPASYIRLPEATHFLEMLFKSQKMFLSQNLEYTRAAFMPWSRNTCSHVSISTIVVITALLSSSSTVFTSAAGVYEVSAGCMRMSET